MTIEAMKLALEALEQLQGGCTDSDDGTVEAITVWCPEVITALRAAIEQAQPWVKTYSEGQPVYTTPEETKPLAWIDANHLQHAMREPSLCQLVPVPRKGFVPLYATLREWQGLTDEEIDELALDENGLPNSHIEFARAIEAKLKEKNT